MESMYQRTTAVVGGGGGGGCGGGGCGDGGGESYGVNQRPANNESKGSLHASQAKKVIAVCKTCVKEPCLVGGFAPAAGPSKTQHTSWPRYKQSGINRRAQ